ncbi:DMT family transporter [Moritella sp. F3]|uniref:DMT family transporter n=1 Tax=Moritella sp. F3 TaxID=2718882 RepID=UPI001A3534D4|nr:DMT family transporter [Moritella sp. F3]GIC76907.1 multidrug transporter [Moritella sp. F1]GIC80090.1 multidrug transporter [Moritella sp. F3]
MLLFNHSVILKPLRHTIKDLSPTLKGVLLALISTGLFVSVGVLVRMLSGSIDVFQMLLFRQIVFIVLLLPAIVSSRQALLKIQNAKLHSFRIIGAFFALYFGFLTVSNIPFADATALGFTQVLFVACISNLFLAEKIGTVRVMTILVGFIGVMFVVQPSFEQSSFGYTLLGLGSALGAATAVICVKKMTSTVPKVVLLTYQAVFVGLIALIPSLLSWQWPNVEQLVLLTLVGVVSSIAQWIGISAYKYGEANVIANVEYAKIIYSLGFGYWLFSEVPNNIAILGVMIILLSAVVPLVLNRWTRRTL